MPTLSQTTNSSGAARGPNVSTGTGAHTRLTPEPTHAPTSAGDKAEADAKTDARANSWPDAAAGALQRYDRQGRPRTTRPTPRRTLSLVSVQRRPCDRRSYALSRCLPLGVPRRARSRRARRRPHTFRRRRERPRRRRPSRRPRVRRQRRGAGGRAAGAARAPADPALSGRPAPGAHDPGGWRHP